MASRILSIDLQSDLLTAVILENDVNRDIVASTVSTTANKSAEELITELTTTLDCSDCRCLLSMGAHFFFFRNLNLPFSDRKSINKILPFELEENMAEPIDTMLIDAMVTPREGEDSEIITAMIEQKVLAEYHTALKLAHIPPERITLSGLPSIAKIQKTGQAAEEFIFLDLRLENATLFLISRGKLQLVRSLPFTALADPKAGYTMNVESGTLQVQGIGLTTDSFHKLALGVRQTLASFPLQTQLDQIPIYVDGTASFAAGAKEKMEASVAFDGPCLFCGRTGILPLPIHLPKPTLEHAIYLNSCLSLGKRDDKLHHSFNFCKGEFAFRNSLAEYRNKAKIVGGVLLAALILSLGYLWYDTASLKKDRAALVTEIHAVFKETQPDIKRIIDPVQQLQVAINNAKESTASGSGNTLPQTVLDVLREISTLIPESMDVRLIRMVYEKTGLRLIGFTDTFNTVDSIQKNLEHSPSFSTVTISSTKQDPKDNVIRFELKIETTAGAQ